MGTLIIQDQQDVRTFTRQAKLNMRNRMAEVSNNESLRLSLHPNS